MKTFIATLAALALLSGAALAFESPCEPEAANPVATDGPNFAYVACEQVAIANSNAFTCKQD